MGYFQEKRVLPFIKGMEGKEAAEDEEKCRIKDLDTTQRDALLVQYYKEVQYYLSVFGINHASLADAVQDTMVEALMSIDKLKDVTKLKFWLLTIARRVGIRYLEEAKEQTSNQCSYEEYMTEEITEVNYISDRQLYGYFSSINDEELADVINTVLNEKERKVIILYYVYGHKLKEIAQIIGVSESTVRSISARAKKKLKVKLEEAGYNGR